MTTLTITKSYAGNTALMESDIDNFRNGLLTLFNTDKFSATNFSVSIDLQASKFTNNILLNTDDSYMKFGASEDALFGIDGSKNLVWNTAASGTSICFYAGNTYYIEIENTKIGLPGDMIINGGGSSRTLLQMVSSYRKPVLEWAGASTVSIQRNSGTAHETVLSFPGFIAAVTENLTSSQKYRQASIATEANGYGTSDTGAARGGRRVGLALTTNAWYYVYAVKLRAGSDYSATTAKFIMVFDNTSPEQANETTLDGYYGENNWIYLGVIRYGFGSAGTASSIPKFKYSNRGWCYFYETDTGYAGVNLAYATTDVDDSASPFYTLASGTSGNVIPPVIGHVALQIARERPSDWYIDDTNTNIIWRGGWQAVESFAHGFVLELPNEAYAIYQVRKVTGAVKRAVTLTGFCDSYSPLRKQGTGV